MFNKIKNIYIRKQHKNITHQKSYREKEKIETTVHCADQIAELHKSIQDARSQLPKVSGENADNDPKAKNLEDRHGYYNLLNTVLTKAANEGGECGILDSQVFQRAFEFNGGRWS